MTLIRRARRNVVVLIAPQRTQEQEAACRVAYANGSMTYSGSHCARCWCPSPDHLAETENCPTCRVGVRPLHCQNCGARSRSSEAEFICEACGTHHVRPEHVDEANRKADRQYEDQSEYIPPGDRIAVLLNGPPQVPGFSVEEARVADETARREGRGTTPRDYQNARGFIQEQDRREYLDFQDRREFLK